MRDPQAYLRGRNRSLFIALCGALAVLLLVLLGPGASYLDRLARERADVAAEHAIWQADYREYRPLEPAERDGWHREWDALAAWMPAAADEPSLVAAVARQLERGGVRRLQVQRRGDGDDLPPGIEPETVLHAATSDAMMRVRAIPLSVQLEASPRDLRAILLRLERKEVPAIVEKLHVQRSASGVRARMEIVFFAREVAP
jgi:hypothetical protein